MDSKVQSHCYPLLDHRFFHLEMAGVYDVWRYRKSPLPDMPSRIKIYGSVRALSWCLEMFGDGGDHSDHSPWHVQEYPNSDPFLSLVNLYMVGGSSHFSGSYPCFVTPQLVGFVPFILAGLQINDYSPVKHPVGAWRGPDPVVLCRGFVLGSG